MRLDSAITIKQCLLNCIPDDLSQHQGFGKYNFIQRVSTLQFNSALESALIVSEN